MCSTIILRCVAYVLTQCCILYQCVNIHKILSIHKMYRPSSVIFLSLCKSGMLLLMPVKSQECKIDTVKRTPNCPSCTQTHMHANIYLQRLFSYLKYKISSPKPILAITLKLRAQTCFHIKATADVVG